MITLQWIDSFRYVRQEQFHLSDLALVIALVDSLRRQSHQADYWLQFVSDARQNGDTWRQ